MSAIFASNPAGPMPDDDVRTVATVYGDYRADYNRSLNNSSVCFFCCGSKNIHTHIYIYIWVGSHY